MSATATLPPAAWPHVPTRLPALADCLVLAALLHLLAVALLGSAPGGTARPGEAVWGAIDVRLAGTGPPRRDAEPPPPDPYSGPPGAAAERRWGGVVRDSSAPPPADQAGAARAGTWNPARTEGVADPLPPALAQPPAAAPQVEAPAAPAPAPLPPATDTAPTPAPALRSLADGTAALRESAPLPTATTTAPLAAPAATAAPAPDFVPLLRPPAPVATRTLPAAPAPTPLAPATALPPVATVEAAPAPLPQAPALQAVPRAPSPQGLPQARPADAAPARSAEPTPPRPVLGAPDAGAVVGHDVATPPAAPASSPRLNLDYVRPRGGPIAPMGSLGAVRVLPVPPDTKDKLADDIRKSGRADCRTAYAQQGLVAVVPLAADALRKDGGCRW